MSSGRPLRKHLKHFLKNIENAACVTSFLGALIYAYARLVGWTTKWQKRKIDEIYKVWEKEKSIILIIWHGRTLLPCHFWHHKEKFPMSALVSPHRDGRLIASVLRRFGIKTIDGSSNENASGAALSLRRELQQGHSITIIPDGPKGPNMKLKGSVLYFAQKSGKPIVGMTYSVKGAKLFSKSWDRMLIPPLFSRGIVALTDPFYIPESLSPEQLERERLKIEENLTNLTWKIDKELGLPKVEQGTTARQKKHPLQGKE